MNINNDFRNSSDETRLRKITLGNVKISNAPSPPFPHSGGFAEAKGKGGKEGFDICIFGANTILLCHSCLLGIFFQERFWTDPRQSEDKSQNDRLFHVFLKPLSSPDGSYYTSERRLSSE